MSLSRQFAAAASDAQLGARRGRLESQVLSRLVEAEKDDNAAVAGVAAEDDDMLAFAEYCSNVELFNAKEAEVVVSSEDEGEVAADAAAPDAAAQALPADNAGGGGAAVALGPPPPPTNLSQYPNAGVRLFRPEFAGGQWKVCRV